MISLAALLAGLFLKPALVLGAAGLMVACLRHRPAAARHAVWTGAILALLALPLLTFTLPPVTLRAAGLSRTVAPLLPSMRPPAPVQAGTAAPPLPEGAGGPNATSQRVLADRLLPAALGLWLLGIVVLLARRSVAQLQVGRIARRAQPLAGGVGTDLSRKLANSLGLRRIVELRVSTELGSPAVAGIMRPVILLPAGAECWPAATLRQVLVHELGHVARQDCLLNCCADLIADLYWCNPLVRFAARRMRTESERACDDLVLDHGVEAESYARLLLRLARSGMRTRAVPSSATAMARPRELESRLLAVLDPRVQRRPLPRWLPLALAGLGGVFAPPVAAVTLDVAQEIAVDEPDRRGDALAQPESERLPGAIPREALERAAAAALAGPDSALARILLAAADHVPTDPGDLVRERSRWALVQGRGGRLVDPLLDALGSDDWRVQAYAAWTLASAGDRRATGRLLPLLSHPIWRLRAMAAAALRALHDPAAEPAMLVALRDPAWQVRVEAVEYIAALGGPALTTRLRPRLADRHVAVRNAAQTALTR